MQHSRFTIRAFVGSLFVAIPVSRRRCLFTSNYIFGSGPMPKAINTTVYGGQEKKNDCCYASLHCRQIKWFASYLAYFNLPISDSNGTTPETNKELYPFASRYSSVLIKYTLCVIFWTVVVIFIVVSCNATFRLLYHSAFLRYTLFIWA